MFGVPYVEMATKLLRDTGGPMLTVQEMTDARDKLRTAGALIEAVRIVFLSGGYVPGARVLKDVAELIADEGAALDKLIGVAKP